jgi:hypothetical protein
VTIPKVTDCGGGRAELYVLVGLSFEEVKESTTII